MCVFPSLEGKASIISEEHSQMAPRSLNRNVVYTSNVPMGRNLIVRDVGQQVTNDMSIPIKMRVE